MYVSMQSPNSDFLPSVSGDSPRRFIASIPNGTRCSFPAFISADNATPSQLSPRRYSAAGSAGKPTYR